jgi:signal peptidase
MDGTGFKSKIIKLKDLFFRFWRSENTKISIIRDVLVAFILVFIIIMALWTYTGQWWGAPMVAIESGSMMHKNEPFGRFGTIDAGDMVLLVKVNNKNDVVPNSAKDPDNYFYGNYGDVVVYRPYGRDNVDRIIHRAMCWVEYDEVSQTCTVEGYDNQTNVKKINIPELGLSDYTVTHSGFITKGDNNPNCDQAGGYAICSEPIKVEWISGKARCELPWIGALNLLFNDITSGKGTLGNVPQDSITCLIVLIVILVSIPVSLDLYGYFKDKKKQQP